MTPTLRVIRDMSESLPWVKQTRSARSMKLRADLVFVDGDAGDDIRRK